MHMKYFKNFPYIFYLPLAALDIYLITKNSKEEILLLSLSIFFFLIPTLSLFTKKQMHHIIYRFGEIIFKNSDVTIEYEENNYKKFDKICLGLLITAYILLLLDIPIQILL